MRINFRAARWSVVFTCGAYCGCAAPVEHPEIQAVLDLQSTAWNRGDVDGFMQGYWRSEELTFRTSEGVTQGWQAIRDRYAAKYDTKQKMGRLTFSQIEVSRPADDAAEVSGRYHMRRDDGTEDGGRFYLTMRRIDGRWVIVKDYTVGNG